MKLKTLITSVVAAVAAAVSFANSASAQVGGPQGVYSTGDLLLGIRATGGTGATSEYIVDLGNISQFTAITSGNSLTLDSSATSTIGDVADDLTTFGSWYTSGKVIFSVFGVSSTGAVFVTNPLSSPFASSAVIAGPGADIGAIGYSTFNNAAATANNTNAIIEPTSSSDSYTSFQIGVGSPVANTTTFGYFPSTIEGSISTSLNLDEVVGGASPSSTVLGTFQVASNGNVTYTAAAIPEPSTYALFAFGAAFVFFAIRRQRSLANA